LLNSNCWFRKYFFWVSIIEALYGEEGLKTAILVDQPGSFVVLSTLGILVATIYSSRDNGFQIAKRFFFSTVYHFNLLA
jgi:predicted permease